MSDLKLDAHLIDKDSYYKDTQFISFSGLKIFSKCETLYRDMIIEKTYEEPEHDYFVYGKLVDAMITESPDFIEKNFILVDRKVNPEDALKIENQIKELEAYIADPAFQEKLQKGNKTAQKGLEKRQREISECKEQLSIIAGLADKQQVTKSIWQNAEETALAVKTHPYFSNLEFNEVTSQQIFAAVIDGVPRKGKLDHLKLSPSLTKLYAIYIAGQMSLEALQERIRAMNPNDLWAIITDLKTCYSIPKLEPYSTHYRGQLGFYQDLVHAVLLIPIENITLQAFVADKVTNNFKMAEVFRYTQRAIDELKPDVKAWMDLWMNAMATRQFVSAKEKSGMEQKCFTCSACRLSPFSKRLGEPVLIDGPRFSSAPGEALPLVENGDFSTAEAMVEY